MPKLKKFNKLTTELEVNSLTNTIIVAMWIPLVVLLLLVQFNHWKINEMPINWAFVGTFSAVIVGLIMYIILNIKYVLTEVNNEK